MNYSMEKQEKIIVGVASMSSREGLERNMMEVEEQKRGLV